MQHTWQSSVSSLPSWLAQVHASSPYFSQMEPEQPCRGGAWGKARSDTDWYEHKVAKTTSSLRCGGFCHLPRWGRLESLRGRRWSWPWAQMWDTGHWLHYTCPGERTLTPLYTSHYDPCECTRQYNKDLGWGWWEREVLSRESSIWNIKMLCKQKLKGNIYLQTLLGFNLHFLLSAWLAS